MVVSRRVPLRTVWLLRVLAVVGVAGLTVSSASPAGAEQPSQVLAAMGDDGVYIAPERADDLDEVGLAEIVTEARASGIGLMFVAPNETQPSAEAFALRVRQAAGVHGVVVFPVEGDIEVSLGEPHADDEVRAREAARTAASAETAARAVLIEMSVVRQAGLPPAVRNVIIGVVALLVMLIAATVAEQFLRSPSRTESRPGESEPGDARS